MMRTKACVVVTAVALSLSAQADARGITDTTQVIGAVDLLAVRDGGDDEARRSVARAESRTRELFPSEEWPPRDAKSANNNGRGRGWGRGNGLNGPNGGPNGGSTGGPHTVPDGGTTAVLLGAALCGIEMFRRLARRT